MLDISDSKNGHSLPEHVLLLRYLKEQQQPTLHMASRYNETTPQTVVADVDQYSGRAVSMARLKQFLRYRSEKRRSDPNQFLQWPAWDMLLDLESIRIEGRQLSVSALCISSGAPQSTALRKLTQLEEAGLVRRHQHSVDKRRVCVELTTMGSELVASSLRHEVAFFKRVAATE